MRFITKKDIKIPQRKAASRKGDNGYVLAVGGCENYAGAVILASMAALRSGCDLVKIIAPENVTRASNAYSPDLVTLKIAENHFSLESFQLVKKQSEKFDVFLIGNGIGMRNETKKFCKKSVKEIKNLKVIDADAIKAVSMDDTENSIITPHAKELEYFLLNSKIDKKAIKQINNEKSIVKKSISIKKLTQSFLEKNNIILLKGKIDIIISKNKILYVKGGNPGMTKGGTGDVLAGLCAGFLAQSKDIVQSAINASYFNKKIGDLLLKQKKGFTYLASDMVEEIKKLGSYS
ncbi:MAG: NAD(P)H-hydrate dehydratase [Nanoarchaeota archaeon]